MLQDDDSDELEDMIINPTDSVIVYASTEDDVSHLEVSSMFFGKWSRVMVYYTDTPLLCLLFKKYIYHTLLSMLQVWVLEDADSNERNLYSHHCILIPAFPLCTAWLDCPLKGGERGLNHWSFARYLSCVYLCWSNCLIFCFVQFNFSPSPVYNTYLNWRTSRKVKI